MSLAKNARNAVKVVYKSLSVMTVMSVAVLNWRCLLEWYTLVYRVVLKRMTGKTMYYMAKKPGFFKKGVAALAQFSVVVLSLVVAAVLQNVL